MEQTLTSAELMSQRHAVAEQIAEMGNLLKDDSRDFSPEENDKWEELNNRYDELDEAVNRQTKIERADLAAKAARAADSDAGDVRAKQKRQRQVFDRRADRGGPPTQEERMMAIHTWAKYGNNIPVTDIEIRSAERCGIRIDSAIIEIPIGASKRGLGYEWENRVMTEDSSGTQSDDVVPQGFAGEFFKAMAWWGGMRQACRTVNIPGANPVMWPLSDDIGNTGGIVTNESTALSETDPTWTEIQFDAYRYSSDIVRISRTLMQHSAFDFGPILAEDLGRRVGVAQNGHYTDGTGSGQPQGAFEPNSAQAFDKYANNATVSVITLAELVGLMHSVDRVYRNANSAWMCHDEWVGHLRQLTTGSGGPLIWQDSLRVGEPPNLLGYPVIVNNDMTDLATSGVTTAAPAALAFGDFSKYIIRDSGTLQLRRTDDRYFEYDQVGFVALYLSDGNPLTTTNASPVKWIGNET
jgi:HK97 family phage major capsid protein